MAQECQMERIIKLVLGKWKSNILHNLSGGPLRMSEIEHKIPEAHPRVLKRQIRSLEADGIVQKKAYDEVPLKVEYSLTDYGKDIVRVLEGIDDNPDARALLKKYGVTSGKNGHANTGWQHRS